MSPFIPTLITLTLLGGVKTTFTVDTWHDQAADFDQLQTFDWREPPPIGTWSRLRSGGPRTLEDEVRAAVVDQLGELGYALEEGGEADFLVYFDLIRDEKERKKRTPRLGVTLSFDFDRGPHTDNVLYFELRDPESDQPIWRGRAGPIWIKRTEPPERIERAAELIFAEFPPEGFTAPAKREDEDGGGR